MGMLMKLSCNKCSSQLLFPGDMEGYGATDLAENHSKLQKSSHYKMADRGASTDANQNDWLEAISQSAHRVLATAGKQGGLPSFSFYPPPRFFFLPYSLPALQKCIYLGKCV